MKKELTKHFKRAPKTLKYLIDVGSYQKGGLAECHACAFFYFEEFSDKVRMASINGLDSGNPLSMEQLFRLWILIAKNLSESTELTEHKKIFCAYILEIATKVFDQQNNEGGAANE